jgi:hypothetical protein
LGTVEVHGEKVELGQAREIGGKGRVATTGMERSSVDESGLGFMVRD